LERIEESLVNKYILSGLEKYKFKEELKKYLLAPFEGNI